MTHGIGEGPAEAVRSQGGKRELSTVATAALERESRGRILGEYLAGYEQRCGPLSPDSRQAARRAFDEVFAAGEEWPAPAARH